MALTSATNLLYGLIGLAVGLLIGMWASTPDDVPSGVEAVNVQPGLEPAQLPAYSTDAADNGSRDPSPTPSVSDAEVQDVATGATLREYVSNPDARVEDYVLVDGTLQTERVEELRAPEKFEAFVNSLSRNASAESQAMAAGLLQEFYAVSSQLRGQVTVTGVSCGGSVCAATFQAPSAKALDDYISMIRSSENLPMYASIYLLPEKNSAIPVRRVVFTTDPAQNALDIPMD